MYDPLIHNIQHSINSLLGCRSGIHNIWIDLFEQFLKELDPNIQFPLILDKKVRITKIHPHPYFAQVVGRNDLF